MKLGDNRIFLYREKCFPLERSWNQKLFERSIYPWEYACTSKDIVERPGKNKIVFGRIIDKNIDNLIEELSSFYDSIDKKGSLVISSNLLYRGEFLTQGPHAYNWTHREKGVNENILGSFAKKLEDKGFKTYYEIIDIGAKDLFK